MTPTGIALIAGFIVILIVCIIIDKKSSKKFNKDIAVQYPPKAVFGPAYVAEGGELLYRCDSGTLPGYKKWNLNDIAYIATYKGEFSFLDKDGKTMRGEYLTPSKKKLLKEKAYASFSIGIGQINDFVAFVKKHGPHIEHSVGGEVVQDE